MGQISVLVGDNLQRSRKIVDSATPLRTVLEEANIDYGTATVTLDGATLKVGEMDKSFEQLGVTGEKCMLIAVDKAENA